MHNKTSGLFLLIVWLTLSFCSSHLPKPDPVLFSTDIAGDATPTVVSQMLSAQHSETVEIRFEKGTYHFYPDKGYEAFCHISNHDDVLVQTAFPLLGLKDLKIDGQGSTFVFHGTMVPFLIDDCQRISISNVSVDWAVPFHSEGLIVANDPQKGTFDMEISEVYPYEIRDGQLYFVKEYYEHSIGQSILYDPQRKAIAFDTESYTPITVSSRTALQNNVGNIDYKYEVDPLSPPHRKLGVEHRIHCEQLKPGLVRIFNHGKKLPPVGMILVCKGKQSENRVAPAFRITHTDGFVAQHINVHHAGGMGLIAENSANLTLDDFNVLPSKGRMVSTTADATHFVGCRGSVVIRNCQFNNQLDDASNVHGTYQRVVDLLDEKTIGVRMGHFQQLGFTIGRIDDTVGLVRLSESFFPYHRLTIKSIVKRNRRYQIISFHEELPKELEVGDLIENVEAYPELLVENCEISNNRARGLLLSTPRKTIIRNNYFSTEMEAILIPVESGHWYESGSVSNLLIANNIFEDCQHSGFNRGVIRFVTDDDNENVAFRNVVISENEFKHFDNLIMEVSNTEKLRFTRNSISKTESFSKLFSDNPAIRIKSSKDIGFEDNIYSGRATQILAMDADMPPVEFK